jgi:YfiH family protein
MDELIQLPHGGTILSHAPFASLPFIVHGQTTRKGGFSLGEYGEFNQGLHTGDDVSSVMQNRKMLADGIGIGLERMVYGQQVHGTHVACIDENFLAAFQEGVTPLSPSTDAFITQLPGVALNILTADCIPVFIVDTKQKAIGLAHAGWRGTYDGIAGKTLQAMMAQYGTSPADCLAWIGTGICEKCYEVSQELSHHFHSRFYHLGFVSRHSHLNLAELNRLQLVEQGIPDEAVSRSTFCSNHDAGLFYSYRRSASLSGRMASFLMLK